MSDFDCPACMPEDRPYCDHREGALPLAKVLAAHFQRTEEPTREQMGWFLDDAGTLLKDAGPGPYVIRKLDEGWHPEHAFLLNNLVVTIGEGGKDCPAQPEVVAKFPAGFAVALLPSDWRDTVFKFVEQYEDAQVIAEWLQACGATVPDDAPEQSGGDRKETGQ